MSDAALEASEVLHTLMPIERIEMPNVSQANEERQIDVESDDDVKIEASQEVRVHGNGNRKKKNEFNQKFRFRFQQNDNIEHDESSDTVDVEVTDDAYLDFNCYLNCNVDVKIIDDKSRVNRVKRQTRNRNQLLTQKEQKSDNNDNDDDDEDDDEERKPSTALESSAREVCDRFSKGCECQGACFEGLNAENVYRHRLNIAELTKEEHHMYLMGVSMASLANPKETSRHKERLRQRASYVYHGKRVCLDAFLYLENVTHYQLKRVRSHVMANGVVPRVHGNVRKKPHNTFSLDMYKCAENFLKTTLTQYTNDTAKHCFIVNESRTSIYEKFKQNIPAGGKIMGYSTFRHFLKKQFPHVRFASRPSDTTANRSTHTKDGVQRKQGPRTYSKQDKKRTKAEPKAPSTQTLLVEAVDTAEEVVCEVVCYSKKNTETSFIEVEEVDDEVDNGDHSGRDEQVNEISMLDVE